jgi:OmpA-OmpF porin, OOP family
MMRASASRLAAYVLVLALGACAQVSDRIVLLPDASGTVGAVSVKTPEVEVLLEKPFGQVEVSGGKAEVTVLTPAQVRERYAELLAVVPQRVEAFVLYFEAGKTELAESSKAELQRMLAALGKRAAAEVVVVGHTDRVGPVKVNDEFSLMRAFVVRELLLGAGVPAAVISVAGRGEREPLVPTEDEVAEPRNRRVEIRLR